MVVVKFKSAPFALVLFVFDLVIENVPLNWLEPSSLLLIATISPVPITEPTLDLELPPLPEEDSAAFATEFVVPPLPPEGLSFFTSSGVFSPSTPLPPPLTEPD